MRILVVTHYYSTHAGGIEIVAASLASRLAITHSIAWVASDCDPLPLSVGSIRFVPMRTTNVVERVTGIPFPVWGPLSLVRLWSEVGEADVVHLHDFAYMGNWAACLFAVVRSKGLVITQHVGFIPYRSFVLRTVLRALHLSVGRVILRQADQVIFVSRVVRDYFSRFAPFKREPVVVSNGVDATVFVRKNEALQRQARAHLGLRENAR